MKVEIWSDVMCPFCYIGKRKFEAALAQFPQNDSIEIVWRSFQLDPNMKTQPDKNVYDYLAEVKGQTREWSIQMHQHVTNMAKAVGLDYRFDKAVVANSFDAHRVVHMAKQQGLGDAAEERIFKAYFTEGKNTADHETLAALGEEIGLDKAAVLAMLKTDAFAAAVRAEMREATEIGVTGVPFFVLDRKYAVSGAQDPQVFAQALQQAFSEWRKANPVQPLQTTAGQVCTPTGCD